MPVEVSYIIYSYEGGIISLTLSNDQADSTCFIIFQRDIFSNPSDIELGLNKCYVESSEVDVAEYDVFTSYKIDNSQLHLYEKIGTRGVDLILPLDLSDKDIQILSVVMPKLLVHSA